jgi:hypothetical protein
MALRFGGIGVLAFLVLAGPLLTQEAWSESFETRLSPSPLTDGTRINIIGEGRALVQWDGNILSVSGNFTGLATGVTTAALYDGLGIGIPGPKAFDLTVSPGTAGTIWASIKLTSSQLRDLRAGHFYVQVDSEKAPDGNLTGWLLPPYPFAGEDVPVAGPGFLPQFDVPQKSSSR